VTAVKKLKLLIIAPYEGLKGLCESIIQEHDEIEADIFTASLDESIQLISGLDIAAYDVVMSRGTTGEMLQKAINRPVLDIKTSVLDVIRAMQLAQNGLNQFAFVGFPELVGQVRLYCEFMQITAGIYTIDSVEHAQRTIQELQDEGCLFIIGDGIAVDIAKSMGMGHILITSGAESVRQAIDNAVVFHDTQGRIWAERRLLDAAIGLSAQSVVIFDDAQNIVYTNDSDKYVPSLAKKLRAQIPQIHKQGARKFYETVGERDFSVSGQACRISEKAYILFSITKSSKKFALSKEPYKTEAFSQDKLNNNMPLYNSSEVMTAMLKNIKNCSNYSLPILISGESGCGKETLAYTVYALGSNRNGLFFTMDCASIGKQDWQYLMNNEDSPLYDNGNSIYFKEIFSLPLATQQELCNFIKHTSLFTRNQVMSSVDKPSAQWDETGVAYPLYQLLNGITLNIPPLRERIKELPSIAACYINEINQKFPTEVIGFEEEALHLLNNYEWPHNIDQLKQVVKELVILTNSSYITAKNVRLVLNQRQNKATTAKPDDIQNLDLNRTLADIEADVINMVLRKNDMNQSLTARQLGVSRGTLWRKLKK